MILKEFLEIKENPCVTAYDVEWDTYVTVDYIKTPQDNYDKFLNKLVSLVTVTRIMGIDTVIVNWSTLIEKNMDKFIQFASENWI